MDNFIALFLGVLIGLFHAQIYLYGKPIVLAGWEKFKAWRASRVA